MRRLEWIDLRRRFERRDAWSRLEGGDLGVRLERRLGDSRLSYDNTRFIYVKIGAGVNTAWKRLINEAMALRRLNVADDIPMHSSVTSPHEDLPEYDTAIRRRGSRRGECRALVVLECNIHFLFGFEETLPRQRVRRDAQRAVRGSSAMTRD